MEDKAKTLDIMNLQIEAIRAQAFAQGYTAALQWVAEKANKPVEEEKKETVDVSK